jgi:hypothetical protein
VITNCPAVLSRDMSWPPSPFNQWGKGNPANAVLVYWYIGIFHARRQGVTECPKRVQLRCPSPHTHTWGKYLNFFYWLIRTAHYIWSKTIWKRFFSFA